MYVIYYTIMEPNILSVGVKILDFRKKYFEAKRGKTRKMGLKNYLHNVFLKFLRKRV